MYQWKVGSTSFYARHYYVIGWSDVGKSLSMKVIVRTNHGGFARNYLFGLVRRPA